MRTDRLTLGRPRPPIADFWATAEHTTWLHRAFRWHVPRKCHAVPPLESLTTLAHVPPLSTRSRFGPSRNRRPPSHRTSQRLPRRRRPRRRTRPPFPCRDEFTFRKITTGHREKIFGRTVSLRRNRGDAEKITHDTLIRAHRGLATFRGHSSLATSLSMVSQARPRAGLQPPFGQRQPDAWPRQNHARHPVAPSTHPHQGSLDLTPLAQPSALGPKHFPCASGPPSPMSYPPCPLPRPILPRS